MAAAKKTAAKKPAKAKAKKNFGPKVDHYQRITDKIVAQLEAGVRPWAKPWKGGAAVRPRRHDGTPYKGINVFWLWLEAEEKGYTAPTWMTYKQAETLGGQVRKGEKSSLVVFSSRVNKSETDDAGKDVDKSFWFLKGYTVFNVAQIDGLPASYYPSADESTTTVDPIPHADEYFKKIGVNVRVGGGSAYCERVTGTIAIPHIDSFKDAESYYATLGHEHIHWSGHEGRLNREFGKKFGDEAYAAEELVAEIGAAYLCADLGLTLEPRADHADYIGHWLGILKGDKRFILRAASLAQKAVEFLNEKAGVVADEAPNEEPEFVLEIEEAA